MPGAVGNRLNDEWKIGAVQCFYSKDGTWFHRLVSFPGALCDPNGYVRFDNEQTYLNYPGVSVSKQTNVHAGIHTLQDYVRMRP
jgi:hypothetical protein